MKKLLIFNALIFFYITGSAQRLPKYISENGFWVVETNLHQPKSNIVYFYNNNNELLYKEKVEGLKLRLNKWRVKMNLKKVLDQSLLAYEQQKKSRENEMLVAAVMSKR